MEGDLIFRVLKRYYILGENQDMVAKAESTSKSTVSRLLKKAEQLGYVRHVLDIPLESCDDLAHRLVKEFPLSSARVLPTVAGSDEIALFDVALTAGQYLNQTVQSHDVIGISWGNTVRTLSDNLPECPRSLEGVRVVQLNGSISNIATDTHGDAVVRCLAKTYKGQGFIIPAPSFVDSKAVRDILMKDSTVASCMRLIDRCDIAVFSVGALSDESVLIKAGYITEDQYRMLRELGCRADICGRYIMMDGSCYRGDIFNRVIGVSPEGLKSIPVRMGLIAGSGKAEAALAALRGGFVTHLFIDERTACKVLDLIDDQN